MVVLLKLGAQEKAVSGADRTHKSMNYADSVMG